MKNFRRILSLATTLVMLISMVAVPQVSAAETADEVLVFADFEETKGGFQGQYASGNTTMLGGVDRVYTDDSHGKAYRIFSKAGHATDNSARRNQIAYVNFDEAVSSGTLHISYEMKMNDSNASLDVYAKSAAINETHYTNVANGQPLLDATSTAIKFYDGSAATSITSSFTGGTWYQVDTVIDFTNKNATFYVDGQKLAEPATLDAGLTGISSLMFKVGSIVGKNGGATIPASVYIDNFKVTKLGTVHTLGVDSTTVSEDKETVTLNLSETVPAMPTLAANDVKVVKRGADASVAISSVTAANKKISIALASALDAGTEYEISVEGAFSGLNGGTANGLKGYAYVNPEKAARYEETFDDGETTFRTTGDANQAWSIASTEVVDYEGRGKVYRAYNTDDALSYAGYQTSSNVTVGYQNFAAREALEESQYLENDGKYVISYSSMLNGNGLYTTTSKTTYQYPKYGFALSSRTAFANTAWRRWDQYDPHQATSNITGYVMGLAVGGGTSTSDKTIGHHVASYKTQTVGTSVQALVDENRIKKYATTDDKYVRLNTGEWYDIEMVVDIANETVDYYYDGKYVGTQTEADGLDFDTYIYDTTAGAQVMNTVKPPVKTLIFGADFGPKASTFSSIATTVPGEYILDNIKIEEFDGSKFDKQLESIRFVDEDGNKAFSTATVSTLYNKIELTGKNVANVSDFGAVTLTATPDGGSANTVDFTASYENGIYTIDLGKYLTGNTTYTLSALGEEYAFKTDAGSFEVESIELYKVTGSGDDEVETLLTNIADVAAGDKVRSTVKFINTTGKPQNAWLPIAYYNGKRLSGVMYDELSTDGTETEITKSVDITVSSITDLSISGFVWESKDVIRPLIKNTTLD